MSDVRGPTRPVGDRRSHRRGVEEEEDSIYRNEALVHSAALLVGCPVDVQVANGNVYAGILKTISPKLEFGLEAVHLKRSAENGGEIIESVSKDQLLHKVVFDPSDILCLTANGVNPTELLKKEVFQTDSDISQCNGLLLDKELERWEEDPSEVTGLDGLSLDPSIATDGWKAEEMFETNQKKFNVQTSYQEDMLDYTTELKEDDSEEFKQRAQRAELLARKKETDYEYEDNDRTEEERFSSVVRPVDQQPIASEDPVMYQTISDCSSEAEDKSQEHADEPEAKSDDQLSGSEPIGEETQSPVADPLSQNLRNQAVRTGGGSRQPNMPSIPEDQAPEGKHQRHKMMKEFKDLRDFSENFTLGDKPKSVHTPTDLTNQPEKDGVSVSTLNPEAKAFKPANIEPKPGSPASHVPILHSPVYSPLNSQLHISHASISVPQPSPHYIPSPIVNYPHGQPMAGVHMQQYQPQIRQRQHHIPAHFQMPPEMPGSPVMSSVPQPMYVTPSPPVQYSAGHPQVVPVPRHGPSPVFVPVGSPEMQGPVILMQQQQSYHQSPYGQPMPGHHVQPGPTMMPTPYVISPQGIHYNTPPSPHMHQMQFSSQFHPLAAPSPGPIDHRTHQNRHGPSPPLLLQHPSPAIPIPPSGRSPYPVGPGSQGPMG